MNFEPDVFSGVFVNFFFESSLEKSSNAHIFRVYFRGPNSMKNEFSMQNRTRSCSRIGKIFFRKVQTLKFLIVWKSMYYLKKSFSQRGEDIIVSKLLKKAYKISRPFYVDIGAHHPFDLSNTALFYQRGASGISVEADPVLFAFFQQSRDRDICVNAAILPNCSGNVTFYKMTASTLSTFSLEKARKIEETTTHKIIDSIQVNALTINELLKKSASRKPDFISIDIEGLDTEVIRSLDFELWAPKVICIENDMGTHFSLTAFLENHGYFIYYNTGINTIFAQKTPSFNKPMIANMDL